MDWWFQKDGHLSWWGSLPQGNMSARAAAVSFYPEPQAESRETELEMAPVFNFSKPTSSGIPLPMRPHLLSIPIHQMGTNSNARDYGRYVI